MTLRTRDELAASVAADLADNTTGAITPAVLRNLLADMVDSLGVSTDPWHQVGETDEPAFTNGWDNFGSGETAMAFRDRGAGIIDIQGFVSGGTPAASIFTLPADYRPATPTGILGLGTSDSFVTTHAVALAIDDDGTVTQTLPNGGDDTIYLPAGVYFLDPAPNA